MDDQHRIHTGGLAATIAAQGAELTSLRDGGGEELLWQAGPEWPRHAPLLFPIVGRLANDTLRHAGQAYRLTQHGFARDSRFEWTERGATRAALRLRDSEATRAAYPFAFVLEQIFTVQDATLTVTTRVTNPGEAVLPCAVGAHPAFRWPLRPGTAQEDHRLEFDTPETGPALPIQDGLLAAPRPLPFDGTVLPLAPGIFAEHALVMPDVASRSLRFAAPGRALTISWEGYKDLGLWSPAGGAPFLCIEPWFGMASPVGWDGDFMDKPGILLLGAGESRDFTWRVAV